MEKCKNCGSKDLNVGIANTSSGSTIYPMYCETCGDVTTRYVKKEIARNYAIQNAGLKYVKTKTMQHRESGVMETIKCERCGANEGERHHWAPSHLFEDAEQWPVSYLCRDCHAKWHRIVTPNMCAAGQGWRKRAS